MKLFFILLTILSLYKIMKFKIYYLTLSKLDNKISLSINTKHLILFTLRLCLSFALLGLVLAM